MEPTAEHEGAMLQWMVHEGCRVHPNLKIRRGNDGLRSVFIDCDVTSETELFAVPLTAVLSPETATDLDKTVTKSLEELDWNATPLLLMMELSKGKDSRWWPYLRLLPKSLDTPLFWKESELEELIGTYIYDEIGKDTIKDTFVQQIQPFMNAHPQYFTEEHGSVDAFLYAGSIVMAYAFFNEGVHAMVPLADLLNHRTGRNNARIFAEDGFLVMRAIVDIACGSELINTYGDHGNGELVRRYGFYDEDNVWSMVEFSRPLVMECCRKVREAEKEKEASPWKPLSKSDERERKKLLRSLSCWRDNYVVCRQALHFPTSLLILVRLWSVETGQVKDTFKLIRQWHDRMAARRKEGKHDDDDNNHNDKEDGEESDSEDDSDIDSWGTVMALPPLTDPVVQQRQQAILALLIEARNALYPSIYPSLGSDEARWRSKDAQQLSIPQRLALRVRLDERQILEKLRISLSSL